jgi:hypothetical protein
LIINTSFPSAAREAGALLPVQIFVVENIKDELEDVDIKEESFYDEKVCIIIFYVHSGTQGTFLPLI